MYRIIKTLELHTQNECFIVYKFCPTKFDSKNFNKCIQNLLKLSGVKHWRWKYELTTVILMMAATVLQLNNY